MMKSVSLDVSVFTSVNDMNADGMMCVWPIEGKDGLKLDTLLGKLPAWLKADFASVARKRKFEAKAGSSLSFDAPDGTRKTLICVDAKAGTFEALVAARKIMDSAAFDAKVIKIFN